MGNQKVMLPKARNSTGREFRGGDGGGEGGEKVGWREGGESWERLKQEKKYCLRNNRKHLENFCPTLKLH